MRRAIAEAFEHVRGPGSWPTFTLNNHDSQRIVTRLGHDDATAPRRGPATTCAPRTGAVDLGAGTRRARAAAGLLLAMPGAVYLYQGEELGLPEVLDLPDEARQDPVFARTGGGRTGRDGCRIPLPWTAAPGGAHGFSLRRERPAAPWLPQPDGLGAVRGGPPGGRRGVDAGAVPAADRGPPRQPARSADDVELVERPRRRRRAAPRCRGRGVQRRPPSRSTSPRRPGSTPLLTTDARADGARRAGRHHGLVRGLTAAVRTRSLASPRHGPRQHPHRPDGLAGGRPAEWWFLLVIFGIAFLDSVIPIVPSETTVILGGVAAGAGDQNLLAVIAAGALGAFLGDNTAYLIGRRFARWIQRRAARREKTSKRLDWATTRSAGAAACC